MKKCVSRPVKIERNIKSDIFKLLNKNKYEIIDSAYPEERIAGLIDAYCHTRNASPKCCKQFITQWLECNNLDIEY